jgi:hypothetical protein
MIQQVLPSHQNSSVYLTVNGLLGTTSISKLRPTANGVCILFSLGYFSKPKQKSELSDASFEAFVVL